MRYQMVIQADSTSRADHDAMLSLEERVERALKHGDFVDGHDSGSGEWNIFLDIADPGAAFANIAAVLEGRRGLRVAYREMGASKYVPMFPSDLRNFRVA